MTARGSCLSGACAFALASALAGATTLHPSSVQAFCRTTTVKVEADSCPEPCDYSGIGLFWDTPDIVYTLNGRGFPAIDEATESRIFAQSFAPWESVSCGGTPVGFHFAEDAATSTEFAVHHESAPNKNVLAYLTASEWSEVGHSAVAFALTSVYYNPRTGRILGADTEFNGGMPRFGECPDNGCDSSSGITDLRNVATHEIGHILGLAHTSDKDATMSCDARPGDTDKRSLGSDDVAGLCAAYPPGQSFVKQSSPSTTSRTTTCSVQAGEAPRPGPWLLGAISLTLYALARRRGVRRHPSRAPGGAQ